MVCHYPSVVFHFLFTLCASHSSWPPQYRICFIATVVWNVKVHLFFPGQQHLFPVLLFSGQHYWHTLAHPGPQQAAERQAGWGRPAEPDPAVLSFCQSQPPEISAQSSASWTQAAATGPQPNQQHQPRSFPEPAQPDASAAAGKQTANHHGGGPQGYCNVSFPFSLHGEWTLAWKVRDYNTFFLLLLAAGVHFAQVAIRTVGVKGLSNLALTGFYVFQQICHAS